MNWFDIIKFNPTVAKLKENLAKREREGKGNDVTAQKIKNMIKDLEAKGNSAQQASAVAAKRKEIANVPPAPTLPPVKPYNRNERHTPNTARYLAGKERQRLREELALNPQYQNTKKEIEEVEQELERRQGQKRNVRRPNTTPAPPPTNAPQTNVPQTPKYGDFSEPKVQPKAPQRKPLQGYNPATPQQKKNLSGRVKAALQRRGAKKAGFRNVEDYEYYKPKNIERRNLEESIKTQRENLKRKKQQMSSSGGL